MHPLPGGDEPHGPRRSRYERAFMVRSDSTRVEALVGALILGILAASIAEMVMDAAAQPWLRILGALGVAVCGARVAGAVRMLPRLRWR
jgi:hypothetical protein